MKKNRAFLKWAGGKYPLLNDIEKHLPQGECLIEPFVGAGSVFLNTRYSRYILADINSDLIDLYNIVKTRTAEYISAAQAMFVPANNNAEIYYQLRTEFNQCREPLRRAVLFLYLNRHGYNGLCRYNLKGEFNVPFGRYKKAVLPGSGVKPFCAEGAERRIPLHVLRGLHGDGGQRLRGVLRSAVRTAVRDRQFYRLPHQQL